MKPSNVMLDLHGAPHVMDFGLAKRDVGEITMTVEGQVLGTPAYMSPEQAGGNVRWVDRRTDVYSLGVMLFQMLTGELPFRGTAQSQIQQRLVDDAPSPRKFDAHTPLDLATVCMKCLERDPNRRYATAKAFAEELRRYLRGEPVIARPLSRMERAWRWAKRRPAVASALTLGAVLAVGGPISAALIYQQSVEIDNRLAEREVYISQKEGELDLVSQERSELAQKLDALQRGDDGLGPLVEGWRQKLIVGFIEQRGSEVEENLATVDSSRPEAITGRLGYARLCRVANRPQKAAKQYLAIIELLAVQVEQQEPKGPIAMARNAC